MSKLHRSKGSALLMVVGLMTIVVMLGITYLLISQMDAKNSASQANALQAAPMTDGSLLLITENLAKSLCLGANGPYSAYPDPAPATTSHALPTGVGDWRAFATSPTAWNGASQANICDWLSSSFQNLAAPYQWPHVGQYFNVPNPPVGLFDNVSPGAGTMNNALLVDATGGNAVPVPDSRLFDSGITNSKGQHFFVAIRTIDLSSMACLNTGGTLATGTAVNASTPNSFGASAWPASATGRWSRPAGATDWTAPQVMLYWGMPSTAVPTGVAGTLSFVAANPLAKLAIGANTSPNLALSPSFAAAWNGAAGSVAAPSGANFLYQVMTDLAITPMAYDLNDLLIANLCRFEDTVAGANDGLHSVRCGLIPGTTPPTTFDSSFPGFSQWVGKQLFTACSPLPVGANQSQYLPFTVSDEAFLRCPNIPGYAGRLIYLTPADAATTPNPKRSGPLGPLGYIVGPPPTYNPSTAYLSTSMMTTLSVSRPLLRCPTAALKSRVSLYKNDLDDATNGPATRDALYNELVKFMPNATQAVHVVANMWAASGYTPAVGTYTPTNAFKYTNSGVTAYGLVPQPFITEAVAAYIAPTVPLDPTTAKAFYAVEIRNYSGSTIDLSQYKLGSNTLVGTLTPGANLVCYYCANGILGDFTTAMPALAITGSPYLLPLAIDLSNGGQVKITRTAGATTDIPVDSVLGSDIPANLTTAAAALLATGTNVCFAGARDDNPDRMRYALAKYAMEANPILGGKPTLGSANTFIDATTGTALTDPFPGTVAGYTPFVGPMASIGNVGDLFVTGPEATTDLPYNLMHQTTGGGAIFATDASRGKVDFRANVTSANPNYPDVPWGCLVAELVECAPTDASRIDDTTRIYGRININTANEKVLQYLPWPSGSGVDAVKIADYIVAYRDKRKTTDGLMDYTGRVATTGITGLRVVSDAPGYLSPGELAIPLGDYMTKAALQLTSQGVTSSGTGYLEYRDMAYKAVANCITVNSDTFAAYVLVQLYANGVIPGAAGVSPISQTRYLAVFDRSNCRKAADKPAILLTTPLP